MQTIYSALLTPRPRLTYRRERWTTPDDDFIDLDWIDSAQSAAPLLVLFHGLEGGSRSHYALALMHATRERGWRGVVAHFRGCSGEPNRLPRAYHSGDSEEVDWILRRLRGQAGEAPLFALGVSLGGNALLKWAGERGRGARETVQALAAVSAPMDLRAAGDNLARGFNRLYTRCFLRTLKPKALQKIREYPSISHTEHIKQAITMREYDEAFTAPLHGFAGCDDYWRRASSKPHLAHIAVPTLVINALNDPFLPAAALARGSEVSASVQLDYPATGGHAGFAGGAFPGAHAWLPQRVLSFFAGS